MPGIVEEKVALAAPAEAWIDRQLGQFAPGVGEPDCAACGARAA